MSKTSDLGLKSFVGVVGIVPVHIKCEMKRRGQVILTLP